MNCVCVVGTAETATELGYARVSSREQSENSHALEQQIERLKREGCHAIYWDVESAYKGKNYPGLNQVLESVRLRKVARVTCTRVDRMSRRSVRSFAVFEDFIKSGVTLRVLDEPTDLTTASGKMVAGVLAVMAQHHSDSKAEAIKHGWAHLRTRKVAMQPPFGYVKVGDRFELDTTPFVCLLDGQIEQSKAVIGRALIEAYFKAGSLRGAIKWLNQTYGIQTVAHQDRAGNQISGKSSRGLFRFSPAGFQSWVTNPVLCGHLCYLRGRLYSDRQTIIHHDTHPEQRLMTEEERLKVDELLAQNKRVRGFGSTRLKYPLSGLVFCGECRSAHYSVTGQNNYHKSKRLGIAPDMNYYFQCHNWRTRGCEQRTMIRMEIAETAVVEALRERAEQIANIADRPDEVIEPPLLIALRQELASLQCLPNPDRVKSTIVEIESQIESERRKLLQSANQTSSNTQQLTECFTNPAYWESLENAEKQQLYRALVSRVVVKDGAIERIDLKV